MTGPNSTKWRLAMNWTWKLERRKRDLRKKDQEAQIAFPCDDIVWSLLQQALPSAGLWPNPHVSPLQNTTIITAKQAVSLVFKQFPNQGLSFPRTSSLGVIRVGPTFTLGATSFCLKTQQSHSGRSQTFFEDHWKISDPRFILFDKMGWENRLAARKEEEEGHGGEN